MSINQGELGSRTIYIRGQKVEAQFTLIDEPFDQAKINSTKRIKEELSQFRFDMKDIKIAEAEASVVMSFHFKDKIYEVFLGYHPKSEMDKMVSDHKDLLLSFHYIDYIPDNILIIKNVVQACFSFWVTDIHYHNSTCTGSLDFYGAYFYGKILFTECKFQRTVSFKYAKFLVLANFENSVFSDIVMFERFTYYNLSLQSCVFRSNLLFRHVNLLLKDKEESLKAVLNIDDIEIVDVDIPFTPELSKSLINFITCSDQDTKTAYSVVYREYQILNKIYKNRGNYDEEDETFLLYRKYRMKSLDFNHKKIMEYLYYYIGGFGTKLSWIFLTCCLTILLFFFLYFIMLTLKFGVQDTNLTDSFIVTFQSFFSFGFTSVKASVVDTLLLLMYVEGIIGFILMIYFTVCFSRKAAR